MDCLDKFKVKEYDGQPVTIAQIKFDDYYVEVYKNSEDGIVICTKKQEENLWPKLKKHDVIRHQVESLPDDTILRCELHAFSVQATSVPTLINDADSRLMLSPFKIELWAGISGPIDFEYEYQQLNLAGFIVPDIHELVRMGGGPSPLLKCGVEMLKERAIEMNVEGWVVKDVPGGKCWKIKPQKTVDAFVVGYTISESDTFAGGLKAVQIAVMDDGGPVEVASCGTGFDADYRMKVDPKSLIGRVGEFKYQDVAAKGKLKFPRFLRWRDEGKTPKDCTISQLKGI